MEVAVTGLIVGLGAAMSFGPMALLCVRRTLAQGRRAGLLTGVGIALGDTTYALVAALGIHAIASILIRLEFLLSILGATLLCIIGARGILHPEHSLTSGNPLETPRGSLLSAYGLTLTNPMTILFFAAVYAGVNLAGGYPAGIAFVIAVFAGSMLWWLVLTSVVSKIGEILRPNVVVWLNRTSGILIIALALGIVVRQIT